MPCPCPHCGCINFSSDDFFVPEPSVETEYLLRNNEPPHDEQIESIENQMAVCIDALSNINSRLTAFEDSLDVLYDLRAAAQASLTGYESILHPSRRIPTEILINIFSLTINPNITTDYFGRFDVAGNDASPRLDDLPFALLGVCHRWRDVALSLPQLWSVVDIHLRARDRWNLEGALMEAPLARYLQLSKGAPLTISLMCAAPLNREHPVVRFLINSAPQWRNVLLYINPEILVHLKYIQHRLHSLQQLHLKQTGDIPVQNVPRSVLFNSAPNLHHFTADLTMTHRFSILPWPQITRISPAMDIDPEFMVGALPLLSSLQHAEFFIRGDLSTISLNPRTLPELRYLSLMTLFKPAISTFFSSITCPRLESLELKANLSSGPFVAFVERSNRVHNRPNQSIIRTLVIDRLTVTPTSLLRLLRPLKSLESLTFMHCPGLSAELFMELTVPPFDLRLHRLTYTAKAFDFLPSLTQLTIHGDIRCDELVLARVASERQSLKIDHIWGSDPSLPGYV